MEGNYRELLGILQNPQNPQFEDINKLVSENISNHNNEFLQGIVQLLSQPDLNENEIWYAFFIIKQYFITSITQDKFHDAFPSSAYPPDVIIIFREIAFRFFNSTSKPLRSSAVELFYQTVRVNIDESTEIIPQLFAKITQADIQYVEILAIIQFFISIYSEIEVEPETAHQLLAILLPMNSQFADDIEFRTLFINLLSQFNFPVFQSIPEPTIFQQFLEKLISDYQEKPSLKVPIVQLLTSSVIDSDTLIQLIPIFLPLFHSDLQQYLAQNLDRVITLTIMNFIDEFLIINYPSVFEICIKEFLPLYLLISQTFTLENDIEAFEPNEYEPYVEALDFCIELLNNEEFSNATYEAIYPFISEGILSTNLQHRGSAIHLLAYAMKFVKPEIIQQTIDLTVITQSIAESLSSEYAQLRFYGSKLLYSSCQIFQNPEMFLTFYDSLFERLNDAEIIARLGIDTLKYISINENFVELDMHLERISSLLTPELFFMHSSVSPFIVELFTFPQKRNPPTPQYIKPITQYLSALLTAALSIPEEQVINADLDLIDKICEAASNLLCDPMSLDNAWIELGINLYQKFHLGTDLLILVPFMRNQINPFTQNVQMLIDLIVDGFETYSRIHSLFSFITFASVTQAHFDLSELEFDFIGKYIEIFNFTDSLYNKFNVIAALALIIEKKPQLFTQEICIELQPFFIDLSSNVDIILSSFDIDECKPFYKAVCEFFSNCVRCTIMKNVQVFFDIINQFILSILDTEELENCLLIELKQLVDVTFANPNYQARVKEIEAISIYRDKYNEFNQKFQSPDE